ncbi:hypothetical protein [Actinosynnema sp.]
MARASREAAEPCLPGGLPPVRAENAVGTTGNGVRSDIGRARLGRAEEEW